jgi:hypothetical protein
MSVHDAVFWLGVTLLGAGLFVILESKIYGWILIAAGVVMIAYGFPPLSLSGSHLPAPPLLPFTVVVLIGSALAARLHRYRDRALLVRKTLALAERLDDFAQICQARLGSPFSTPLAEREVKERMIRDEYVTTFGANIRGVHRALTVDNEPFADLLDTMLGSRPNATFKLPALATWVAKTLRLEATLLQRERPWVDLRLIVTFCVYLASASAVWLVLWLASSR